MKLSTKSGKTRNIRAHVKPLVEEGVIAQSVSNHSLPILIDKEA
jgi:hypothetical protein